MSGEMLMIQTEIFQTELNIQHDCEYSQGWLQKLRMSQVPYTEQMVQLHLYSTMQNKYMYIEGVGG